MFGGGNDGYGLLLLVIVTVCLPAISLRKYDASIDKSEMHTVTFVTTASVCVVVWRFWPPLLVAFPLGLVVWGAAAGLHRLPRGWMLAVDMFSCVCTIGSLIALLCKKTLESETAATTLAFHDSNIAHLLLALDILVRETTPFTDALMVAIGVAITGCPAWQAISRSNDAFSWLIPATGAEEPIPASRGKSWSMWAGPSSWYFYIGYAALISWGVGAEQAQLPTLMPGGTWFGYLILARMLLTAILPVTAVYPYLFPPTVPMWSLRILAGFCVCGVMAMHLGMGTALILALRGLSPRNRFESM